MVESRARNKVREGEGAFASTRGACAPQIEARNKKPSMFSHAGFSVLATSYSRTAYRRTTIGAAAFHCRVRNGNGWGHCAIVTRDPSRIGGFGASRRRESLMTMSIFQRTADSLISTYRVWEHAL